MKKRITEIGDLIFKLDNEAISLLSFCNCRRYDCHNCQKVRQLKEQITILDNERKELKERINSRVNIDFPRDREKAFSGKEEWEQEEAAQEPGGDYSLFSMSGRKYGGSCSDCGAKGETIMLSYIECGICKERTEGDENWRCQKCHDKKYPKHSCVFKKAKNKLENEENKNNPSPNTININISNNSNAENNNSNIEGKLEQIIQKIEELKQVITQLEKTGTNPKKVQELKHQVQNLESQKAQLIPQQNLKPLEKNQEIENEKKETSPNATPTKPENYKIILFIGTGLLIVSALVIGYLLGKLRSKTDK